MDRISIIRALNDQLRCQRIGGDFVITAGVAALGEDAVPAILRAVAVFADFTADNDPYGEHDCACLTVVGYEIIWKIDYFDRSLTAHSPDAANATVTRRVMTIMLASEY